MKAWSLVGVGGLLPSMMLMASPLFAMESAADKAAEAIENSEVKLNLRYRLEHVDQDNLSRALASTLRTRVGVTTGKFYGWQALLEVDNVSVVGNDLYNSTRNGRTDYAVVADPQGTDVNQGALRSNAESGAQFVMGRQRINQLNQRFVGGVGWRQNEQTFDGYRVQYKAENGFYGDLNRLHNVNRIFGPRGPAANQRGEFYNLVAGWEGSNDRVTLFVHDLDFNDWAARSSRTMGLDYSAVWQPGLDMSLQTHLVYARQEDAYANPLSFTHSYHRMTLGGQAGKANWLVGQERLAGDGNSALQTPLATLHAFQGFTDVFLNTPVDGIRDSFMRLSIPLAGVNVALGGHYFVSDNERRHYGNEFNFTVTQRVSERLSMMYKGAHYNAHAHSVDSNKLWVMLTYQL